MTAVTAQNPDEVRRVDILSSASVRSQLETILDLIPVRFAKTGMLAERKIIRCVAKIAAKYKLSLIVDPVMVSTSGVRLLEESAVEEMKNQLFPLAEWLTPNIPEAELICNRKISSTSGLVEAAKMLFEQYNCNIILKSGHLSGTGEAADIVCHAGKLFVLSSPRLAVSGNTAHGTGCTLSSALTANLALGKNWRQALLEAKAFVCGSLAEKVSLSNELCQMYPPAGSWLDKVQLDEL